MSEYIVEFGEHPSIEDKGALREKIVRCRDCKHNNNGFCGVFCCGIHVNGDGITYLYPDFFCASGEGKEGSDGE